jgi:hypothetical protein
MGRELTRWALEDLPERCRLFFGHIELDVHNNVVQRIKARSPSYRYGFAITSQLPRDQTRSY